jgi:hypothetical protein
MVAQKGVANDFAMPYLKCTPFGTVSIGTATKKDLCRTEIPTYPFIFIRDDKMLTKSDFTYYRRLYLMFPNPLITLLLIGYTSPLMLECPLYSVHQDSLHKI